jgi:hypothetical protein
VGENAYVSKTPLDVGNANIEDLLVPLRPGVDVKVGLVVDGTTDDPRFHFQAPPGTTGIMPASGVNADIELRLERKDGFPFRASFTVDTARTSLIFPNVPEGDYRITANLRIGTESRYRGNNYYIEDILMAGRSVYDNGIQVGIDRVDFLEILVGTSGGAVEGTIPTGGQTRLVELILVPDVFRRQNPSLYRSQRIFSPGENATFVLRGIPAGDYKIFAVADAESPLPYRSVDFVAAHEARAASITVRKGDVTGNVLVPLIELR